MYLMILVLLSRPVYSQNGTDQQCINLENNLNFLQKKQLEMTSPKCERIYKKTDIKNQCNLAALQERYNKFQSEKTILFGLLNLKKNLESEVRAINENKISQLNNFSQSLDNIENHVLTIQALDGIFTNKNNSDLVLFMKSKGTSLNRTSDPVAEFCLLPTQIAFCKENGLEDEEVKLALKGFFSQYAIKDPLYSKMDENFLKYKNALGVVPDKETYNAQTFTKWEVDTENLKKDYKKSNAVTAEKAALNQKSFDQMKQNLSGLSVLSGSKNEEYESLCAMSLKEYIGNTEQFSSIDQTYINLDPPSKDLSVEKVQKNLGMMEGVLDGYRKQNEMLSKNAGENKLSNFKNPKFSDTDKREFLPNKEAVEDYMVILNSDAFKCGLQKSDFSDHLEAVYGCLTKDGLESDLEKMIKQNKSEMTNLKNQILEIQDDTKYVAYEKFKNNGAIYHGQLNCTKGQITKLYDMNAACGKNAITESPVTQLIGNSMNVLAMFHTNDEITNGETFAYMDMKYLCSTKEFQENAYSVCEAYLILKDRPNKDENISSNKNIGNGSGGSINKEEKKYQRDVAHDIRKNNTEGKMTEENYQNSLSSVVNYGFKSYRDYLNTKAVNNQWQQTGTSVAYANYYQSMHTLSWVPQQPYTQFNPNLYNNMPLNYFNPYANNFQYNNNSLYYPNTFNYYTSLANQVNQNSIQQDNLHVQPNPGNLHVQPNPFPFFTP